MFNATIIKDSVNKYGIRAISMELEYPTIILAEFNTHRMHCLAGDNILKFDLPAGSYKSKKRRIYEMSLEDFATKWHSTLSIRNRLSEMQIRQFNEETGEIITSTVKDVIISGEKEIFKLSAGKFSVSASKDHLVLTSNGWKSIENIEIGEDSIICEQHTISSESTSNQYVDNKLHKIQGWQKPMELLGKPFLVTEKTSLGIQQTYDLEIAGKYPNFLANGIVVHNSRSSSSQRAIPIKKTLKKVWNIPFIPIHWGKNMSGMQAKEELSGLRLFLAKNLWILASKFACIFAYLLDKAGLHKQIGNRIMSPWMWTKTIVTSTEWDNFFELRMHSDAQPEFYYLANLMYDAIQESVPKFLNDGEWHLPYVDDFELSVIGLENAIKCSTARCARVSYLNHNNDRPDITEDLRLHDLLVGSDPKHSSPAEMQLTPAKSDNFFFNVRGYKSYRWYIEKDPKKLNKFYK